MNGQKPLIRSDKYGNPFQVVGTKDKKGNGFSVGYVELGGHLYKVEPSIAKKDDVHYWVRITKLKKDSRNTSM
jgi:hypothetical protein